MITLYEQIVYSIKRFVLFYRPLPVFQNFFITFQSTYDIIAPKGSDQMKKLGMVLEGGGMRGVYTAGVLDFFMDQDFYPDGIVGVSAGACHATSYISKQKGRNYRVNTAYLKGKDYLSLHSLIKKGSLFGMGFIFHKIP